MCNSLLLPRKEYIVKFVARDVSIEIVIIALSDKRINI